MCGNVRKRALRNGRDLDVTFSDLMQMIDEFCSANHFTDTPRSPFLPSIDRINHAKGYTRDNIRVTWLIENLARNVFTDADVLEFCRRKLASHYAAEAAGY